MQFHITADTRQLQQQQQQQPKSKAKEKKDDKTKQQNCCHHGNKDNIAVLNSDDVALGNQEKIQPSGEHNIATLTNGQQSHC